MTSSPNSKLEKRIAELEKECAYLRRKLARKEEQQIRQENIDDINRRLLKQTNEQLLQYHQKAKIENLSKSDFLANMSHEIRTPLNIILGMANLIAETSLSKTQSQYLNSLRVTGRQLMEILNNILEFSRIEAGKITVESEPFSLQKIINQIEASALPLCLQKQLDFLVEHDPLLVMERVGDQLKLFQVLLNLINNAVKFTTSGSITLKISEDYQSNNSLVFSVIDTGIGISEDQQKIIFDRFTQANESLAQQHSGAGLGLSISQKLTGAMGGKLTVESAKGKGSIFNCHLPLPPASPPERRQVRMDATLILPDQFPRLNILAVDDIHENLEVIKVYLSDYPITIDTAENGQEALYSWQNNDYDIILMDVRMPVMDGITATKQIRNKEKKKPGSHQIVLAITAHAFQEQKNKFLETGFDGVLTKPFFKRELIQTLFRFANKKNTPILPEKMGNKAIGYCLEKGKISDIPKSLAPLLPELQKTILTDLAKIKEALQKSDYDVVYETAHSLKGVSGMFGLHQLASLITDFSQSVRASNIHVAEELLASLDAYLHRFSDQPPN